MADKEVPYGYRTAESNQNQMAEKRYYYPRGVRGGIGNPDEIETEL